MKNFSLKISFLSIIILLSACVTPASVVREKMDPWIGQSINTFILSWGAPDSVYDLPNGLQSIYSWEDYSAPTVYQNTYKLGNTKFRYSTPTQTYCIVRVTVNEFDVIENYSWEGQCRFK